MPGRDGEHAQIVGHAALARRDEVGQRQIRPLVRDDLLLPQHREAFELASPRIVGEHHDVVAVRARRPERVDAAGGQQLLVDDAIEQRFRVLVELARGRTVLRMLEDARKATFQLPRREEERPVDEPGDLCERQIVEEPRGRGTTARRSRARPSRSAACWRAPARTRAAASRDVTRTSRESRPARPGWRDRRPASPRRAGSRRRRRRATRRARGRPARWYSGAIFTAVCCRLVVAPPMRSGTVKFCRVISCATNAISSSDGVMSPLSPMMSTFCAIAVSRIFAAGTMTPRSMIS